MDDLPPFELRDTIYGVGNPQRLAGIVLAAGRSSRMGRPKALLPASPGGEPFVARIVRTLQEGGVDEVIVVGPPGADVLRTVVSRLVPPAHYVENPAPERGQLSSLLVGLDAAESRGAEAVLVTPVDIPLFDRETVATLIGVSRRGAAPIVRPSCQGRHGHPVVFLASTFQTLRQADMSVGASAVLRSHPQWVLNVDVSDAGVLNDVDLPEDYRKLFGRDPL